MACESIFSIPTGPGRDYFSRNSSTLQKRNGASATSAVIVVLVHAYFAGGKGNAAIDMIEGMQHTLPS